jgi:hypothetical protein
MVNVSLLLFRDDRSASGDAVAIVRNSIRSRAGHYSLTEINVQDHQGLAAQYNVQTTPTILLVKNGDIVDRIVGTPTTSLVHNLLDTRTAPPQAHERSTRGAPDPDRRRPIAPEAHLSGQPRDLSQFLDNRGRHRDVPVRAREAGDAHRIPGDRHNNGDRFRGLLGGQSAR